MMPKAFYYLNSNVIRIVGLRNSVTKQYINGSMGVTVTVDLIPTVSGGSISMSYVPGSNGVWEVVFPTTVGVTLGSSYTARITASGGSYLTGRWNIKLVVEERQDS